MRQIDNMTSPIDYKAHADKLAEALQWAIGLASSSLKDSKEVKGWTLGVIAGELSKTLKAYESEARHERVPFGATEQEAIEDLVNLSGGTTYCSAITAGTIRLGDSDSNTSDDGRLADPRAPSAQNFLKLAVELAKAERARLIRSDK